MAAIDEQVGHRLRAVELHEQPPRSPLPGNVNIVLVVARRFEPAPRRAGIGVPGVRQRDMAGVVARVLRLEEETPPFVERIHLARPGRTGGEDEQQSRKDSFHGGTVFLNRDGIRPCGPGRRLSGSAAGTRTGAPAHPARAACRDPPGTKVIQIPKKSNRPSARSVPGRRPAPVRRGPLPPTARRCAFSVPFFAIHLFSVYLSGNAPYGTGCASATHT